MSVRSVFVAGATAFVGSALAFALTQEEAVTVEPAELARRLELIGKLVVVDDHVAYYVPRTGDDPDELQLKRTKVTFLVPRKLRPESTRMPAVAATGTLRRDGSKLVCDVSALQSLGPDLERLEKGVKGLSAKDYQTRVEWARWAQRRAKDFKDDTLLSRSRELEAEAFRIETSAKRLGVDAPKEWLKRAMDARRRKLPPPEPAALAHRAFRAQIAAAPDAAELRELIEEIKAFFPDAAQDRGSARTSVSRWEERYKTDPSGAYRDAPESARKALDRRLWADATEMVIDSEAQRDLAGVLAAAEKATTLLPERTDLPAKLIERGVAQAKQNLAFLTTAELKELVRVVRDKLNRPEEGRDVIRAWLLSRRSRLGDNDAAGALELAGHYEDLLGDPVTAVEMLRKAWRADPNSKDVADAFKSRGFRRVKDEWVEARQGGAERPTEAGRSRGLTGMTAEEARQKMGGKPNHVNYIASKGQMIEQWIYLDTQGVRYVNILHSAGDVKPRVVAFYTLPVTKVKVGLDPKR